VRETTTRFQVVGQAQVPYALIAVYVPGWFPEYSKMGRWSIGTSRVARTTINTDAGSLSSIAGASPPMCALIRKELTALIAQ